MWDPSNEAFGMTGPGGLQGPPALLQHALGSIVMDVVRGEDGDPAMAMFGVVPREERSAEGDRGGDVVEAAREAAQVSRYRGRYGLVLATNLRDFVLLGEDAAGRPARLETFRLAGSVATLKHYRRWPNRRNNISIRLMKSRYRRSAPKTDFLVATSLESNSEYSLRIFWVS